MVKRNSHLVGSAKCFILVISPWEVFNNQRANNYLCQAVLDFQKINKNKYDPV